MATVLSVLEQEALLSEAAAAEDDSLAVPRDPHDVHALASIAQAAALREAEEWARSEHYGQAFPQGTFDLAGTSARLPDSKGAACIGRNREQKPRKRIAF